MSDQETIEVFDMEGKLLGVMSREEAEAQNHLTKNVLVFLFNSHGHVWVQLRPETKKHYPGLWDISACGGVVEGEQVDQAAKRETLEETGLKVDLRHVKTFLNVFQGDDKDEERQRLSSLYIGFTDETPRLSQEVDEFKLWEPKLLREDVLKNSSSYIPSFVEELDLAIEAAFS